MSWIDKLILEDPSKAEIKALKPVIDAKAQAARMEYLEPFITAISKQWAEYDWDAANAATNAATIAAAQGSTIKVILNACNGK